ncbi:hypothetical protein PS2_034502 [Malus domestica]
MHEPDKEKTAFVIKRITYCYKVMPFGFKNTRATYKRLENIMFTKKIGVTTKFYVEDIMVKGKQRSDHIDNLAETFDILRKYKMKLNPAKCTFEVSLGRFIGFKASNNEAEYEAIVASLRMAKDLVVKKLAILSDFQLITSETIGEYTATHLKMVQYLENVREQLEVFQTYTFTQVLRGRQRLRRCAIWPRLRPLPLT